MFIYNFKIYGGLALKIIIVVLSLFMLGVFAISVYKIFFTSGKFLVKDKIEANEISEVNRDINQAQMDFIQGQQFPQQDMGMSIGE